MPVDEQALAGPCRKEQSFKACLLLVSTGVRQHKQDIGMLMITFYDTHLFEDNTLKQQKDAIRLEGMLSFLTQHCPSYTADTRPR